MLSEPRFHRTLTLKDGRRLGYAEAGDPQGRPVIYCHGFPASRLEAALVDRAALRLGARIVVPDRPGYGLSDYQPGRRMVDWPGDVEQLADALGFGRFAVLAVSGGGPYGLALCHAAPGRVAAASVVAGLGPVYDPEAVRPMRGPARFGFASARKAYWLTRLVYGALLGPFLRARPELALALLTIAMPESDRATLSQPDTRAVLCAAIREGLRPGVGGALLDFKLYTRDWGFEAAAIRMPVDFWHGEADGTVPLLHSQMLAALLPQARLIQRPGEGHFSLPIQHTDEILEALLAAWAFGT
jgi:pimeloyl-ACP methyl ester carboxylesterase